MSVLAVNDAKAREFLTSKCWPNGLQKFLLNNISRVPYRFFICDDSGSMASDDGKRLVGTGKNTKFVGSTRWAEMSEALIYHATLAEILNVPCQFRLLNAAVPLSVGGFGGEPNDASRIIEALRGSPGGGTPLCRHISEVAQMLQQYEGALRQAGQRACIIIATDGEASDGDLAVAMKPLEKLPVWVIVKLCTDEDNVVTYWDNIDGQLEVDIDVLDDMSGESEGIYKANPWLNYNEVWHRMREFGVHMKEMDMLDEKLLSADQVRSVCSVMYDVPLNDIPHPEAEFEKFITTIQQLNSQNPEQFSIYHKKMMPLVDVNQLKRCYGPPSGGCCVIA